jgi:hypothetical protein
MPALTAEQVRAMAEAIGLAIGPDDLEEVTHRLNAFHDALAPLGTLPLHSMEPLPVRPESDGPWI